jgi:hypothetical protein
MGQTGTCKREREAERHSRAYLGEALQRSLVGDGAGSIPASAAAQGTAMVRQRRWQFGVCRHSQARRQSAKVDRILNRGPKGSGIRKQNASNPVMDRYSQRERGGEHICDDAVVHLAEDGNIHMCWSSDFTQASNLRSTHTIKSWS